MRHLTSLTTASRFRLPSISFSGAGFLGIYHAGAYASLLKHGHLLQPKERIPDDNDTGTSTNHHRPPILTGVSAGSLISAAISAGVTPEDVVSTVLTVSERTKEKGGVLDVLQPGFSLIDQLEDLLRGYMQTALGGGDSGSDPGDYDNDLLMNRIRHGDLLRIGMADRRTLDLASVKRDLGSYLYADRYRNLTDITSACILSSYIPIGTGPLRGENDPKNLAVKRAWEGVQEMERMGFLKHGVTGLPLSATVSRNHDHDDDDGATEGGGDDGAAEETDNNAKLRYIDGGLVNMFPEIDASTLIVSPVNGSYVHPYIAPNHAPSSFEFRHTLSELMERKFNLTLPLPPPPTTTTTNPPRVVEISDRVHLGANAQNLYAGYLMMHSSGPDVLEEKFREGYDDTHRFLKEHGLLTTFSVGR